jgi:GNAT superfamily N-acetyltransferase
MHGACVVAIMIRVRRCEPEEVRALCDDVLLAEDGASTWDPDGTYWAAFERTYLPAPSERFFSESVVAFGGFVPSRRFRDAVFFHCAGVAEGHRGKRLQRRLIRARIRGAKREGYSWAVTYTLTNNPASSRSLIACGFRPYWPAIAWAGNACYWYRKLT